MGNHLSKFCCKAGTSGDEGFNYPSLRNEQREKLEEFYRYIVSNASVDFSKQEINDIENAVHTMFERIRSRVNERGIFKIARTLSSGSMNEKTSLWKYYEGDPYLEFDNLAVLENTIQKREDRNNCEACVELAYAPVAFEKLKQFNIDCKSNAETIEKHMINVLFLNEINYCLTSSSDCLKISIEDNETVVIPASEQKKPESKARTEIYIGGHEISFQSTSTQLELGCDYCTVDMPTGTLSINTNKRLIEFWSDPNKCSLIFLWASKTNNLLAPDELLFKKPKPMLSLPIYADFLPALESRKPNASGDGDEHDFFIVPKSCNVCTGVGWRKSWCRSELRAFNTEMSNKHRMCYQIMKYLSKRACSLRSDYHLKTAVLRHHTTCSDTAADAVDCVFAICHDLIQAYTK